MNRNTIQNVILGLSFAGLAACGGGGSGTSGNSGASSGGTTAQSGTVSMMISDDSIQDWSVIGVKVLSITLTGASGTADQTVYTAPANAPMVNLTSLDQISDLLANASVNAGTYTGAVITLSANPGDVLLTASNDPDPGFAGTPGATVNSADIDIQKTSGSTGSLTTSAKVQFEQPITVSSGNTQIVDLDFQLDHPIFIVAHPSLVGATKWAVSFNGPVRHHRIDDLTHLVLRHLYGDVTAIATDNSSITVTKEFATLPVVNPEVPVSTGVSVTVLADSANGSIFYDVDAGTKSVIKDFSQQAASLSGKQVRIAARYQSNGSLVATRIWASTDFNKVWLSPEGHVRHVDTTANTLTVLNESGAPVQLTVDANTQFVRGNTVLGTGTSFLANQQIVRGFKVHTSVVDPLATPLVAQTVDIETAAYGGPITAASAQNFTYTRTFGLATDDYTVQLSYIDPNASNGTDSSGAAIKGFKYWNFAYPTLQTTGTGAVGSFVTATTDSVNFGGTVGTLTVSGASYARWGDGGSNATGWYAPWVVLLPQKLPLGSVVTGIVNNQLSINVAGGTQSGTVSLGTTSGSATLVYQVDRTNGVVTVSPVDITTTAGIQQVTTALVAGSKVKVTGIPQADGTLKAYTLTYYTGDLPTG